MAFNKSFFIIFLFLISLISCNLKDFSIGAGEKEIHVDFVVFDKEKSFYNFTRFVLFPERKMSYLIFFNPISIIDERINDSNIINYSSEDLEKLKNEEWSTKIKIFSKITDSSAQYYVYLEKENFINFFNYLGGVQLMLLKKLNLKNSEFIYLNRKSIFFGEKLYDFISLEEEAQDDVLLELQEKHFRFQTFLVNFLYQLPTKNHILGNKEEIKMLYKILQTNLNENEFSDFMNDLTQYDYVLVELPLVQRKVFNNNFIFLNIQKSKENYNQIKQQYQIQKSNLSDDSITIEILNASSTDRLARNVKAYIHSKQFQVLGTDNYPVELDETLLIDNTGNLEKLKKLEKLLNISEEKIFFIRRLTDVQFTYILGKDFDIKSFLKRG